jgi:hypothetical protein
VSDPCDLRQRVIAQPPKNVKTREKVHKGGGHFTIRPEKCQAQPLRKSRRDVRGYINHKISTRSCHKISTIHCDYISSSISHQYHKISSSISHQYHKISTSISHQSRRDVRTIITHHYDYVKYLYIDQHIMCW